jgi:hypothetical protein
MVLLRASIRRGRGARPEWSCCAHRFVVDEARDPLFSDSALAGDEDRGIDLRHAARQVHYVLHLRALGDDSQRLVHVARHADHRMTVCPKLVLCCLQRLRDRAE